MISKRIYALMLCLIFVTTVFGSCATTSEPVLTKNQLAAQGIDQGAFERGRALAITECAGCHRFYWPHEYSSEQWPGIIKKMGSRSSLSKSQVADLETYFVTVSRKMSE